MSLITPKKMRKLVRIWNVTGWLVLCCLLALGQLQRWQIGLQAAVYGHEVWLTAWLFGACFLQPSLLARAWQRCWVLWRSLLPWSGGLLIGLATGWLVAVGYGHSLLIPALYMVRLVAYGFALVLVKEMVWNKSLRVKEIVLGVLGWGMLLLYFGLLQYFLLPDMRWLYFLGWDDHYYRLISTLLDPGFTGLLLVFTFCFVQWWPAQFGIQKLHAPTQIVLSVALIVGILLTYSRATYGAFLLALTLAVGWQFMWRPKHAFKQSQNSWRFFLMYAGLFLVGILLLPHKGGEGVRLARTSTVVARQENVQTALASLQPIEWITGRGLFVPIGNLQNQAKGVTKTQTPPDMSLPSHAQVPDNWAIMALTGGGVLLFVSVLGCVVLALQNTWHHSVWLGAAVLALLFHGLFNASALYPFAWLFLGFFTIAIATKQNKS